MKVLSLFDGISCGRLALESVGVDIEKYYASEIEKASIETTSRNRPDTIQLGDVRNITKESVGEIDLLIGGSPCTGFSNAGKGLNFNDPQSKLFFDYVRILNELKPKYFMLENVKMKQEWLDVITKYMGVDPVFINSSSFSAQNRQRYYWTNIPLGEITKSKFYNPNETMENVVERTDDKYYFSTDYTLNILNQQVSISKIKKISTNVFDIHGNIITIPELDDRIYEDQEINTVFPALTPKRLKMRGERARRFKPTNDKSYCLTTQDLHGALVNGNLKYLSPIEWEKLQKLPRDWTTGNSDLKRYKMIGNCWTVSVISYLFEGLK